MNNTLHRNNFDILRLLLAICVMIFHIGRMYGNENLSLFPGTLAVQAFFIISGYLITESFERSRTLKDYSIKRLRRIAPGLYFLIFNGSLWTLIVEVFFYIFIPILCFVFRSQDNNRSNSVDNIKYNSEVYSY